MGLLYNTAWKEGIKTQLTVSIDLLMYKLLLIFIQGKEQCTCHFRTQNKYMLLDQKYTNNLELKVN